MRRKSKAILFFSYIYGGSMSLSLFKLVNKEQLLHFALSHIEEKEYENADIVSKSIVIWYIYEEFEEQSIPITDNNVAKRFQELLLSHTLDKLNSMDLVDAVIDEDGEVKYRITNKGKEMLEKYDSIMY